LGFILIQQGIGHGVADFSSQHFLRAIAAIASAKKIPDRKIRSGITLFYPQMK
jgi:hypothetical protein